jgi:hypothetical protein
VRCAFERLLSSPSGLLLRTFLHNHLASFHIGRQENSRQDPAQAETTRSFTYRVYASLWNDPRRTQIHKFGVSAVNEVDQAQNAIL